MTFGYRSSFQLADKGCIELLGPFGFASNTFGFSKLFATFQTGNIFHYALMIAIGLVFALSLLISSYAQSLSLICYHLFGLLLVYILLQNLSD
jgi:hypothetical protein